MTATDAVRGPGEDLPVTEPTAHTTRLDVEGLRGIAVGLVLLYHLGLPLLPGGFVGVDVFFVISGFLITSLMLREVDRTGTLSLRRFYARRARRLLPAASLVLLTTALAGWWLLPGSQHENLGRDVVASAVYLVNWELADRSVDYLAEGDLPSPLQHYWSLSVEEQFYVVWPLLVLLGVALARRRGTRVKPVLLATVVLAGLASFVAALVIVASDPAQGYFVSTTRVWELAVGAALAFAVGRLASLPSAVASVLAWGGGAAVLASGLLFTAATPWPGWAAAVPVLGTAALLAAGGSRAPTGPGRALSWRPLVALGGISYATYLWHWPIIVVLEARWGPLGLVEASGVAVVTLVLAWLTGRLVERPIRFDPRLAAAPLRSLLLGAVATSVVVVVGVVLVVSVPEPPTGRATVPGARALVADPGGDPWSVVPDPETVFTTSGPLVPDPAVAPDDNPRYARCVSDTGETEPRTGCDFGDPDGDLDVVMLGDSKMEQWFPAVNAIAVREGWRLRLLLKSACAFSRSGVVEDCAEHTANVIDQLAEDPPDRALISQRIASSYDDAEQGLTGAVGEVADLGVDVVVVADNPSPPVEAVYDCVELHPGSYDDCGFDRSAAVAESGLPQLSETADALGLPLVDLDEWICPEGVATCPPAIGGALVYRQGSHLTDTYVRTLTPMLHRALADVGWTRTPSEEIRLGRG